MKKFAIFAAAFTLAFLMSSCTERAYEISKTPVGEVDGCNVFVLGSTCDPGYYCPNPRPFPNGATVLECPGAKVSSESHEIQEGRTYRTEQNITITR